MADMADQEIGVRGAMVALGLGTPLRRAFVVGIVVGIVAFTAGLPKSAFTDAGELRPQRGLSNDPQATDYHFLAVPLSAALITYLI